MSLLLNYIKKNRYFDSNAIYSYKRMTEYLEEMKLEEKQQGNIFTYSYNNEVWASIEIKGNYINFETPVTDKIAGDQNNPLFCFVTAYLALSDMCVDVGHVGLAVISRGLLLSRYMTYVTNGAFKSKRIIWDD